MRTFASARLTRLEYIGTEDFLLAMVASTGRIGALLQSFRLTAEEVLRSNLAGCVHPSEFDDDAADRAALAALGIDLDALRPAQ